MSAIAFKKARTTAWEYFVLTLGSLIFCFSWQCFVISNNMSSGGLTGLCTLLQMATNGLIPVSLSYLVINIMLLLVAFFILGNAFGIRTIYCILLTSVFFKILPNFEWLPAVEGNFFYVKETIMIPIIGGLLEAVGLGIIFRYGGSTGGSDIIAMIVNKFWPVSPGKFFLYTDFFIVLAMLLIPGKTFNDVLYGLLMMLASSFTVDYVLLGGKSTVQVTVFSEKYDQIADYIINYMDRGVTALNATGWYTKADRKVLLIMIRSSELRNLTKKIKEIDHRAFVSVLPAKCVYGEGFEEIKTGVNIKKKLKSEQENG